MGLDVWFSEDISRACRAAEIAAELTQAEIDRQRCPNGLATEMAAYWRGYAAALATLRAAFGLAGKVKVEGALITLCRHAIEYIDGEPS